jgi:hypothetical protein
VSTLCNEDGSAGETSVTPGTDGEAAQSAGISFTYALKSENGAMPVDADLIVKFEKKLQARLSCVYFDFPCLLCDGDKRRMLAKGTSSVIGISPSPKDEPTSTGETWMCVPRLYF